MIKVTGKRIACTPLFDPLKYGSLYVPDQARERCDQGIVKYVGSEVEAVGVGDHVLFSGYTGTFLDLEGEGLIIILPEEFVVATVAYDGQEVAATPIRGLYFRDPDGLYFTATYEQALNFISQGLEEAPWYKELKQAVHVKGPKIERQRPPLETYDHP